MKYHIITFGCQINKSDSERIAGTLEKIGYKSALDIQRADLIVVNMCSVRQSAVDRVYGLAPKFKKLKTKNYKLKTVLTGCILKTDFKKFQRDFDIILSIKTLPYWKDILKKKTAYYYPDSRNKRTIKKLELDYLKIEPEYICNFSAYIPIITGCNNFCAYCVVPYVRGSEICRPTNEILKEIKQLVKNNIKEIWLLGSNVNSYLYKNIDFAELLKRADKIPGNFWINFASSHPNDFSNKLIKTIIKCKKVSKYISLPIQSGDNEILLKMNRPYTVEDYIKIIKKIKKEIPNVFLSTDIIVGFPGETKKQFENTAKLLKKIKFDMAYIAEYSPRTGTSAFKMKNNVSDKEKHKRREILTEILKKTSTLNSKKHIGKIFDVLIHQITKKGDLVGKTPFYRTVKITHHKDCPPGELKNLVGKIVKVKIIDSTPWGLCAEVARALRP
ncbi:MAG: tRNA (N6-isopentenyl adenosine(37)-C2)-methylthiotransferase MiaB [Candidatus Pacebacteria bacterium]|nr:tRNA (N6-isopentenyl adenosine(37)-C2)-methylthiotransferase MiaB [Candidatus Paceibacterota bacterium]